MRRLTSTPVLGVPVPIQVVAVDSPGNGDPNLRYEFAGFNTVYNGAAGTSGGYPAQFTQTQLFFHDDYRGGQMANGVTENAVLAALIDHLQGKQTGPRACQENTMALEYLKAAVMLLAKRDYRPAIPQGSTYMPLANAS